MAHEYKVCIVDAAWRTATVPHPAVLLAVQATGRTMTFAAVSSQLELRTERDFLISEDDPDFKVTGLDHTSYVIDGEFYDADQSKVLKIVGELQGDLRARFVEWLTG